MAKVVLQRKTNEASPKKAPSTSHESGGPQNMAVYVSLNNAQGEKEDFLMGWIVPEYEIPSLDSDKPRTASVFVYSKDYIDRGGPAVAGPVAEPPPTARNTRPYIVLDNDRLPSFLSNLLPHGVNAKLISQDRRVGERYLNTKSEIERLNILCESGGLAGGGIKVFGSRSKAKPRDIDLVHLTPELLNVITKIDPSIINGETLRQLKEANIDISKLVVNMTGHRTTLGLLAYDNGQEKVKVIKVPSGDLVDPIDEPKLQATMLKVVQAAQKHDGLDVEVHTNKSTGRSVQVIDNAFNDDFDIGSMELNPDGTFKSASPTYLPVPVMDFLKPEDKIEPSYKAITETICPLIKNPTEARRTLAVHMMMQHAFHTTNACISDLVMVANTIEPDPNTGGHFNLVLQPFGMTPDPNASQTMSIGLANGFYNGAIRNGHNGVLPMDDSLVMTDIIQKEFGLSRNEALEVYRDANQAIQKLPDIAVDLDLSKNQMLQITDILQNAFSKTGPDLAESLVDSFVTRKEMAAAYESRITDDQENLREAGTAQGVTR